MANHGAAAFLLIASLLVAVAPSGADARLSTVRHNKAAALRGAKTNARLTGRISQGSPCAATHKEVCSYIVQPEQSSGMKCICTVRAASLYDV